MDSRMIALVGAATKEAMEVKMPLTPEGARARNAPVAPRSRPSASPGYIEAVLLVAPWSLLHEVLQAAVVLFHLALLYCFARKQCVAHERSFHVSPSSLSYQSSADFISSTPMRAFATPSMSPSWMRPSATPSIVPRIVVIVQSHE